MALKGTTDRWGVKQPALRTRDILIWLYRTTPEQFTIKDIVQEFDIKAGEARRRVGYMVVAWGAAKRIGLVKAHRRGRQEIAYTLTKWGQTYASKAQRVQSRTRRSSGGGKAAANPEAE